MSVFNCFKMLTLACFIVFPKCIISKISQLPINLRLNFSNPGIIVGECWKHLIKHAQPIELVIDCSVPNQSYIEDCQVCCRPMIVNVEVAFQNDFNVTVKAEDE